MEKNLLKYLVTPVSSLYIGNWYLSLEFDKLIKDEKIKDCTCKKLRFLKDINCNDIIIVSFNEFSIFVNNVLKKLKPEIKIILITAQTELPILYKNDLTDYVLNHDNVIHWYSHNPIYIPCDKYSPFPYGIQINKVNHVYDIFKLMDKEKLKKCKINSVYNSAIRVHSHLPHDHIRHNTVFNKNQEEYHEYLSNIAISKYIISPEGDREDCFRHWEALLLGCIPISNIPRDKYYPLFGDDMIYDCDVNKIKDYIDGNIIPEYTFPDRKKLMVSYWKNKIKEIINE